MAEATKTTEKRGTARLRAIYDSQAIPSLKQEFGHKNVYQVPRLEKIVLNMGLGEAIQNAKILDLAVVEIAAITGQRPVITKAKKAIANFKLRKGLPIGCMVTLRGERMYEFLDRLVSIALPRVRDFRGVSDKAFDGRGNYSLGIREHIIFPEVDLDKVEKVKGLTVNICTTAASDAEGRALLRALGVPFRA
ncbi:MAG: 50S ribosomal protein L5 [Candidatus Binatia bacterium]